MDYLDDLLQLIDNNGYKVKIHQRIKKGRVSLFFNYQIKISGIFKQKTKKVITLSGNDLKQDTQILKFALCYRKDFEKLIRLESYPYKNSKADINFADYIDQVTQLMNPSSVKSFNSLKKHLFKFTDQKVTLSKINKQFCLRFMEYLISQNMKSAKLYFSKFKQILRHAINNEIIEDMPYLKNLKIKYQNPKREFLTENELIHFLKLETSKIDYKNAFIFCCFTGLRFIDMFKLKFSDIINDRINIIMQKNKENISILLNKTALEIIETQKIMNSDKIFNVKSYQVWEIEIKELVRQAGITKKITGHCARHTFATLCISNGVDIYTTSKLLGHTNVQTTQLYAKLIDEKKDEAIKKLPELTFEYR